MLLKFRFLVLSIFFCSISGVIIAAEEELVRGDSDTPTILHLSGAPYELGYQHGQCLKKAIAYNVKRLIDNKVLANPEHPQIKAFLAMLPAVLEHIPDTYLQELKGLADGAEVPYEKILILNLFPEMFHCTGLTVSGQATKQGELYHVRVLDYAAGEGLQDTAVLMVVKPEGKIPFLNVSYAGFIGTVTGMNAQKIALGEIGGKGYGKHVGMPMAFLLRTILEEAGNLQEVAQILTNAARTCEYYYVFSDGKNNQSVGVYATGKQLQFIEPGSRYAILDESCHASSDDKHILGGAQIESSPYQTVLYRDQGKMNILGLIHHQPADCVAITGFSHPQRYPILIGRVMERYGKIGVPELKEIIKTPVARAGNLHNAIFAPATLDMWIAQAGPKGEPACDETYHHFNLDSLLKASEPSIFIEHFLE